MNYHQVLQYSYVAIATTQIRMYINEVTDVLHVQLTAQTTSGGCDCIEHIHP